VELFLGLNLKKYTWCFTWHD